VNETIDELPAAGAPAAPSDQPAAAAQDAPTATARSSHMDRVQVVLSTLHDLRIQLIALALQWPLASWALQTPLMRGLADIESGTPVFGLAQMVAVQSVYIAVTGNMVLLWSPLRRAGQRVRESLEPGNLLITRRCLSLLALATCVAFMSAVHGRAHVGNFWAYALAGIANVLLLVVVFDELSMALHADAPRRLFLLPFGRLFRDEPLLRAASLSTVLQRSIERWRWLAALRGWSRPLRARLLSGADQLLGAGFVMYRQGKPIGLLPGHWMVFWTALLIFVTTEASGQQFQYTHAFGLSIIPPSTLTMVIGGLSIIWSVLTFLSFYLQRSRFPLTVMLVGWIAVTSWIVAQDHEFFSEPVPAGQLQGALTPAQVLDRTPDRFIIAAAAGGGIQASGWTAQVLAGLQEDPEGPAFRGSLRVVSGVSGGAVGTMFVLGTYDGVWGKAYSPATARDRAMASSLPAVTWGLVFPDLHSLLVPIPGLPWRDRDRGWALERSLARTASGRDYGPTLLGLAPLVSQGLPVVLLNATLTRSALPIVFSNSRFPGEHERRGRGRARGDGDSRHGIRSFHDDFKLETRLETATRMSATFPLISPASRPSQLLGEEAFVDGGYFDNSGLYSLMTWLEQAARDIPPERPRKVLLLEIDAFPEQDPPRDQRVKFGWHRQFTVPFETVIGVRESGQIERNNRVLPLLRKALESQVTIERATFRFRPTPRCSLDAPPLSWHLSEHEKACIREGWDQPEIVHQRQRVQAWLRGEDLSPNR
jgi:hypothetical protein